MIICKGRELIFAHYDKATGAHADMDEVIKKSIEAKKS